MQLQLLQLFEARAAHILVSSLEIFGCQDNFFADDRHCQALGSDRFRKRKRAEANTPLSAMMLVSRRHTAPSRFLFSV
jgi:hypothetical protein